MKKQKEQDPWKIIGWIILGGIILFLGIIALGFIGTLIASFF